MYNTVEEANQKVGNSVVLFEGVPVHVLDSSGGTNHVKLRFRFLPLSPTESKSKYESVDINDPRWDFKSMGSKLGYVDISASPFDGKREAVFATRIPARTSKQGLDSRTVRVLEFNPLEYHYDWNNLLAYEGLVMTVKGKFPTSMEACKLLWDNPDKVKSVAIGRKIMMTYDKVNPPNLIYRNEKVGYTEDGETFKLATHKAFLKEELQDMLYLKIK